MSQSSPLPSRPDYGQDAPGVRLGMFAIATVGFAVLIAARIFAPSTSGVWPAIAAALSVVGALAGAYGLGMGSYMTWGSRVGKLRTRDRLLDLAASMRPWRGDETAVDIGCGRGLMLIGAAQRLPRGQVIGLDLWRKEDQADNSPEAALANARLEGVADHVRIETGDARQLPLADSSVDAVFSHWVIHNLPLPSDREKAINEMWRVLRPGGVLVLADIGYVPQYAQLLKALGAKQLRFLDGGLEARLMGALSGGTYRPQALVALRTSA